MSDVQQTLEASVSAAASKVTGAASAVTVASWLTSSNLGMWSGIVIGITGLVVNWYFKRRSDKRAQELHAATMKKLESDKTLELSLREAD